MVDASWWLSVAASVVIIATPGQGMILVMSRAVAQGPAAGVATAAGVSVGLLRTRATRLAMARGATRSLPRLFMDGALSNLANPKIAVFYFAFLPQFVSPDARHPTLTVLALGLLFALLTFLFKAPVGYSAERLSHWLRTRPRARVWLYRSSGAVLVGLAAGLALERQR